MNIGFLRGILLEKKADYILLEVNGVGYKVEVPASSLCLLPPLSEQTQLHILTFVREDSIRLFGFVNAFDKEVFASLIDVSGIGPKAGLALLGPADGAELCQMIIDNRVDRITTIPGVGTKTAERLVLELKTKLQKLLARHHDTLGETQTKSNRVSNPQFVDDLKSALSNLGYKDKHYVDVVNHFDRLLAQGDNITFEVALKQSLKKLSEHVLRN